MKTSKDPRHQARRLAAGYIYARENSNAGSNLDQDDLLSSLIENLEIKNYDETLFNDLSEGVLSQNTELRKLIKANSKEWDLDKMYKMDISILLLAAYELLSKKAPIKVIIDEAVELAKEFGEDESAKFINGVLAGVAKSF